MIPNSPTSLNVLIVEESPSDTERILLELHKTGYEVKSAAVNCEKDFIAAIENGVDLILSEYSLPRFGALQALQILHKRDLDIPVIIVSEAIGYEQASECMKMGASDYLIKNRLIRLGPAVNQAIRQKMHRQEQKSNEKRIRHLNQVLRAVLKVNELIVKDRNPHRLFSQVCETLHKMRAYRLVWIGLIEGNLVAPFASAGDCVDYLDEIEIAWSDSKEGSEPTGIALRTRMPAVCQDIEKVESTGSWRNEALLRRIASAASIPLIHDSTLYGALNVCADRVQAFDSEELELLHGMAENLAFALSGVQEEFRRRQAEDLYRTIADSSHAGVYVVQDGKFLFLNNNVASYSGWPREEMIGMEPASMIHEEDRESARASAIRMLKGERTAPYEFRLIRKDGSILWMIETVTPILYNGRPAILGNAMNITESRKTMEALRESEERYRTILENIEDGYYEVDINGHLTFFNESCRKIFGYSREEMLGKGSMAVSTKEASGAMLERFRSVLETGKPDRTTGWEIIRKDGSTRHIEASVSLISDENGKPSGFRGIIRDVTDRKLAEEMIMRLAYHDSLTGLPNRVLFHDRLTMAMARYKRNSKPFAVMMLDLDKFKEVNDTLGHSVGDMLLQKVAQRLTELLRKTDTVARMGGDEFLILLTDFTRTDTASVVARKILKLFQKPFDVDEHRLRITTSIGIAVYPDHGDDADTLLKNSDIAMYIAKKSGMNRFHTCSGPTNGAVSGDGKEAGIPGRRSSESRIQS
ncbi:MAG: PAS domain S-box protein [Syntrophales bacterium]|nr:PAS domain S-box protein [Syntrophales bacterium]